ncbi:MAG: hypothetical protein JST55_13425 [Bacteroidetes bacterium]|nr:hypothetical protein [Bacteroidota bacterium]
MEKELLDLSTLDFLLEITQDSLTYYSENVIESESGKTALEFQLDEVSLSTLLKKLENCKIELAGNSVLSTYIDFRIHEIKKAMEKNTISAYSKNPQYGMQYFTLILDILSDKKKHLNKVPD